MEIDLCFTAKMDRTIIEEEHYIVPGGFCFTFDNGDEIEFDFCNSRSCVHADDATSVTFLMEGLDTGSFPGSERLYEIAKKNKIVKINECFVYCGEKDEDPEINVKEISDICISVYDGDYWYDNRVGKEVIDAYNEVACK